MLSETGRGNTGRQWYWSCSASRTFLAPITIAQTSWTSAVPRSRQPGPAPFGNAALSAVARPDTIGDLPQQHHAGVAGQA
ncbi:hypothetical protein SALBM311S_08135 [Streptomyces alboniger]